MWWRDIAGDNGVGGTSAGSSGLGGTTVVVRWYDGPLVPMVN